MKQRFILALLIVFAAFASCSDEDEIVMQAPEISGIEEAYTLLEGAKLELSPSFKNTEDATYLWYLDGKEVAKTQSYVFDQSKPNKYKLDLKVTNEGGVAEYTISIVVGAKDMTIEGVAHKLISVVLPDYMKDNGAIEWGEVTTTSKLYRFSEMTSVKGGTPLFVAAEKGEYLLHVTSGDIKSVVTIKVGDNEKEVSPYFAKAFDYLPAPGQFVNKMPKYDEGDTQEDMNAKVAKSLVGKDASMITLGGWGGYVTMGFDHTIVNVAGKMDFRIEGNGFAASSNPDPNAPLGGSCEPGIIMVSYDANGNGKADDEWYEINGSANFSGKKELFYQKGVDSGNDVETYRDFEMTYHKPTAETPANITDYIYWTNNKGKVGYKFKHSFHKQSYYPLWVKENTITFKGIRLNENGIDESGQGSYFVLYAFRYGYVDNYSNNDDRAAIDIDWAIDKDGNKANLPGIDFVKIYNGVDQENGWLGEASTEVSKGYDLHLLGKSIDTLKQ